jgi:Family of unknown function (DUF5947)
LPSRSPSSLASPRLRAIAARGSSPPSAAVEPGERCDLCGAPLPGAHRHLADLDSRQLLCACRPCSLLFDRRGAGGGHLRLVPERRVRLDRFELSPAAWEELRIPVDMAFFFRSSRAGRVLALYPGPMGATESRLELSSWSELERANPILRAIEDDVEALLVDRARGSKRQWLVPIDDCYRLVALIRTRWRGFTGGKEVWTAIEAFFRELDHRARPQDPDPQPVRRPHGQDQARPASSQA